MNPTPTVYFNQPNLRVDQSLTNQPEPRKKRRGSMLFPVAGMLVVLLASCSRPVFQAGWFAFSPDSISGESVIDMRNWLDKPAGNHGFLLSKGEDFVFEDGTPVKFWGVNICSERPYTDSTTVEQWVDFLARYGVNAVRFHKYTSHGLKGERSTIIVPEMQIRLDYFHSKLRESGIYYGWSPIYGHKVRPGDRKRLLAWEEIANAEMNSHLSNSTIGLVNFAPDVQDLHIELLTNQLNHVNPYTGLRYADDPALLFVEIQNEDNIWFSTLERMLELCPSYKKMLTSMFTAWLRGKYKNQEGLLTEWGEDAFRWGREIVKTDWNLDKGNICPVANQGIYGYEFNKYAEMGEVMPLFLRDMAYFLYLEQEKFYKKASDAIRATGYRGQIIGSCWQAGEGITHFYNLYADFITGPVDRHNYSGGGTGHRLVPGKFRNESMLSKPGSGLMGTGMQATADRTFQISEWMSLMPNEWIAEGSPLVAIYGMGLQGWDASYSFASDYPHYTSTIHTPGVYNAMSPTQIALYPALFAMISRSEIKEAEPLAIAKVHFPSLYEGKTGFESKVEQDWDQKDFTGTIPSEAIAAGKVMIEFSENYEETISPDLSTYHDTLQKTIVSSTGQLFWDYSGEGYFTANTEFSRVLTGFSGGRDIHIGDVSMRTPNRFAVILLTSLSPDKNLRETDRALLTMVARAQNTGMVFNADTTELLDPGHAPIMLEAVSLDLRFKNRKIREIEALNHSGSRTGQIMKCNSGRVNIDGNHWKTIYYEIRFDSK